MIKKLLLLTTIIYCLISCDKLKTPEQNQLDYEVLLEQINYYRINGAECDDVYYTSRSPLQWSNKLEVIANYHSSRMSEDNVLAHELKDGITLQQRLNKFGYVYNSVGENIALGFTEDNIIDGWIASCGHCKNIMSTQYNYVAVANVNGYWTMVLTDK